jgi:hypothetical protein
MKLVILFITVGSTVEPSFNHLKSNDNTKKLCILSASVLHDSQNKRLLIFLGKSNYLVFVMDMAVFSVR